MKDKENLREGNEAIAERVNHLAPEPHESITEYEVHEWCSMPMTDATLSRLTELLTGEYSLNDARNDILSFRQN